jgi:diguanylate cyclase (GGDEF)-like protein/PAS domain S-box-containing protein
MTYIDPSSPQVQIAIPEQYSLEELQAKLLENEITIRNLSESEELFRTLFERHDAIMVLIDYKSLIIVDANAAAVNFYGYPLETLRGMPVSKINVQSESEIHPLRLQAIRKEQNRLVLDHRLANNEIRTVEIHISTVNYKDKCLFFSIIHDITERKQSDEIIRHLAYQDHLTQLPNRYLFHDRLSRSMLASKRSGKHAALIMLDLDNFKPLNDKHGHAVGDLLLKDAAGRLKSCVREIDTVARFGGDEFVIILNELDTDKTISDSQALAVADNILNSLSSPYILTASNGNHPPTTIKHLCTASIGVVTFIDHDYNQEEIMKYADTAMYRAKESGRNTICFYDLANGNNLHS